jgi:tryptophan synthase alpha chain
VTRLGPAFAGRERTGLIPFLTAGFPALDASLEMLRGFERLGALAVEIGIPFSDPIADGPEIQRASESALSAGVGVPEVLDLVQRFRGGSRLPVVLMTYANPVLRSGIESFAAAARAAGVDGVLVSDLPPEEGPEIWRAFDDAGLDTVLLVAPTTDPARLPRLLERARGFVYCLARTGVTGAGSGDSAALSHRVAALRRLTSLPVAVGFGISTAAQARQLKDVADAVVVGAAFMRAAADGDRLGAGERVLGLAGELIEALR